VKSTIPFIGISTLGVLLLLAGQIMFLGDFLLVWRRFAATCCKPANDLVMPGNVGNEKAHS
jgi:hypothetical protein